MTVSLITGPTGSGKTAHVVDLMMTEYANRPIYQMGIRDLVLSHELVPPVKEWTEQRPAVEDPSLMEWWFTFPPNSVIIIDEAQKVFRPRAVGSKVPPEVQAFETHRHLGIDFVLLTQHPGLLDSNVRKLVKRYRHIRETFLGRHMFEWPAVADPESTTDRAVAAKTRYKLPKQVFGKYKSADLHTKTKTRVPWFFYLLIISVLAFGITSYRVYQSMSAKSSSEVPLSGFQAHKESLALAVASILDKEKPRQAEFAHTAPKYDEITKPIDAPWPAGCMIVASWKGSAEKCRCVDQQGNNYQTSDAVCRHIVQNGIFKDWGKQEPTDAAQPQRAGLSSPSVKPDSDAVPVAATGQQAIKTVGAPRLYRPQADSVAVAGTSCTV